MGFSMVPGVRLSCLVTMALLLTLSHEWGVKGIKFAFNGFSQRSDVYNVPDSYWNYHADNGSFRLEPTPDSLYTSVAGRFLYPELVEMMDPAGTAVKDFSTSFIYQILIQPGNSGTGSGLAFIMVPDNFTLGAPLGHLGLLTANTSATPPYFESDNHTFGVELDTFQDPEFGDPNGNHIGIDLASLNSTQCLVPPITLATDNAEIFQQVWIDYFQADSRMDIYITRYGQGKPTTRLGYKAELDMSFLKQWMYIGFSAAVGIESNNWHTILAWSFSNEGEAPAIKIARDAAPDPSPPPPTPSPPPPPAGTSPPPAGGPIAAPSPPNAPPPPPPFMYPSPGSVPSPPPHVNSSPSPGPDSPSRSPPAPAPPLGPTPNIVLANPPSPGSPTKVIEAVVGSVGALIVVGIFLFYWWRILRRPQPIFRREKSHVALELGFKQESLPLHIFISHTRGPDGSLKTFSRKLAKELESNHSYKVFIDTEMKKGIDYTEEIKQNLGKIDLGIVVVTKEFFEKKWPMVELVEFVELYNKTNPPKVRILPLFYKFTAEEIKDHLDKRHWEEKWKKMSTDRHPVDVKKYRSAVETLCKSNGIIYKFKDYSYDPEYIEEILKEVQKLYKEMRE